jgi:PDZ domain-containing protein
VLDDDFRLPGGIDGPLARVVGASVLLVAIVIGVGFGWRVPYIDLRPGPTTNILERIEVTGARTFPSKGRLLLLTANVSDRLPVWNLLMDWADREHVSIAPERLIRRSCQTAEDANAEQTFEIEESKIQAEFAAFGALSRRATIDPGAKLLAVVPGGPADGVLERGDVIVAVDDKATPTTGAVSAALRAHKVGDRVRVTAVKDGRRRTFTVRMGLSSACDNPRHPAIGVFLSPVYRFPQRLDIDTADVGGPSGGLVFTLSLIDVLTPEDLTRGHIVAVTGTIEFKKEQKGTLVACVPDPADRACIPYAGEIGGMTEKVRGAVAAGADVMLVPASELNEARAFAPPSLRVIGVRTVADALRALRKLPVRAA